MIRPLVSETKRYGEYSKPGEFIDDRPVQWGSRRIGPDLAREGGKQGSFWHWSHLGNPSLVSPGSVMPAFDHLLSSKLNFNAIEPHVRAAASLGAAYDEQEITGSADLARKQSLIIAADIVAQGGPANKQDMQAIALIAYLQRVGTDLFRTEEPTATIEAEEESEDEAGVMVP